MSYTFQDLPYVRYSDLEEISIRDEVIDFISGLDFGEVHYIPWIARMLNRDSRGKGIPCSCYNKQSMEGKIGCPICEGYGYTWEEKIIPGVAFFITERSLVQNTYYKAEAGKQDDVELGFITQFDIDLRIKDHLFKPVLNEEGLFKIPLERQEDYEIIFSRQYRLDSGRLEYTYAVLNRVS